jgi:hypothetical protein
VKGEREGERRVVLVGGCLAEGVHAGESQEAPTQQAKVALLAVAGVQTVAGMAKMTVDPVEVPFASGFQVVAVKVVWSYFLLAQETTENECRA